jgi:hypothetical protein
VRPVKGGSKCVSIGQVDGYHEIAQDLRGRELNMSRGVEDDE